MMGPSRTIAAMVFGLVAIQAGATSAIAQEVRDRFGPKQFTGAGGPVILSPGYGGAGGSAAMSPTRHGTGVAPYSYYVLPSGVPSRTYVGPQEFPFYGRPYGRPTDRWNWQYMSNDGGGVLAHYYYPPL